MAKRLKGSLSFLLITFSSYETVTALNTREEHNDKAHLQSLSQQLGTLSAQTPWKESKQPSKCDKLQKPAKNCAF